MEYLHALWDFMEVRRTFWLAPIISVLPLFGALVALSSGSAIAPFVYTLF
jgi:hypothetical protein